MPGAKPSKPSKKKVSRRIKLSKASALLDIDKDGDLDLDDLKALEKKIRVAKRRAVRRIDTFSWAKFGMGFNVFNPIWWSKTLSYFFRTAIVLLVIFGVTFGAGYWRGSKDKPIVLGYKDFKAYVVNGENETHTIEVRDHQLYFDDELVKVGDVPKLKPYGIHIRPKWFAGFGSSSEPEVGLGAEVAYFRKLNLDVFGTNKAFYAGVSYDLEFDELMDNTSVGVAVGKSWDLEDTRLILYGSWKW